MTPVTPEPRRRRPRSLRGLLDARRLRNPASALVELAGLSLEKQRLRAELARWQARFTEIQVRLAEIADQEARLHRAAGSPNADQPPCPLPLRGAPEGLNIRELDY